MLLASVNECSIEHKKVLDALETTLWCFLFTFHAKQVDFLEIENERLRNELETHQKDKLKLKQEINNNHPVEYLRTTESDSTKMFNESDMDQPQYREYNGIPRRAIDSNASSLADSIVGEIDPETMERAALTESVCFYIFVINYEKNQKKTQKKQEEQNN